MPTRKDFEEEMGETYSRPQKMVAGVRAAGKRAFREEDTSYEEDFDETVTASNIEARLGELKKRYKKAKSKEEKMNILREETKLKVRLAEIRGK